MKGTKKRAITKVVNLSEESAAGIHQFRDAVEKWCEEFVSAAVNDRPISSYWTPREVEPDIWQMGPLWTGYAGKVLWEAAIRRKKSDIIDAWNVGGS